MVNKIVLIVEDSKTSLAALEYTLTKAGYTVYTADDGLSGLDILHELTKKDIAVDLIVADMKMPNMDGEEFIKHVRSEEPGKYVSIIVLSTEAKSKYGTFENDVLGVSAWIEKPFQPEHILTIVKRLIGAVG